jgi:hypothetical protein
MPAGAGNQRPDLRSLNSRLHCVFAVDQQMRPPYRSAALPAEGEIPFLWLALWRKDQHLTGIVDVLVARSAACEADEEARAVSPLELEAGCVAGINGQVRTEEAKLRQYLPARSDDAPRMRFAWPTLADLIPHGIASQHQAHLGNALKDVSLQTLDLPSKRLLRAECLGDQSGHCPGEVPGPVGWIQCSYRLRTEDCPRLVACAQDHTPALATPNGRRGRALEGLIPGVNLPRQGKRAAVDLTRSVGIEDKPLSAR